MTFSDFAKRIGSVLKGTSSQADFTHMLFETIIVDGKESLIEEISDSAWKGYYEGNSIRYISKKISAYIDTMLFADYINELDDLVVQKLCDAFSDEVPDIDKLNAGEKIAGLFEQIINSAVSEFKRMLVNRDSKNAKGNNIEIRDPEAGKYANLKVSIVRDSDYDSFRKYIDKAKDYYSEKKTLLYAESSRPFYSIYVSNTLSLCRFAGYKDTRVKAALIDATIHTLEQEARHVIIQGTGGIGKSMFLTHLFLSSAAEYTAGGKVTILALLKDYKEVYPDLVSFICKEINEFAPGITRIEVTERLEKGKINLILDGLDEVPSQLKESFEKNLDSFIKCYPSNMVIISSRPITDFVSYSRFTVYDLQPLQKDQAIELIKKLDFWDLEAKKNFIADLDKHLYRTHKQFASNPLLLTIMLMTYSTHGDIPAKMHTFYAKAYETMGRLHDATKGSFKRPLYTGLTLERFAVFFSQFCARTFVKEQLEFTMETFSEQMKKVIANVSDDVADRSASLTPMNFLRDLTDNLCIMYCEGEKYFFIHRSFQEYFASVYFIRDEEELPKVAKLFDRSENLFWCDAVEMMHDMDSEKFERLIFYPFLDKKLFEYHLSPGDDYLNFLVDQYPEINYCKGEVGEEYYTNCSSSLYEFLILQKRLAINNLDNFDWPDDVESDVDVKWVRVYEDYYDKESDIPANALEYVDENNLSETLVPKEYVTWAYRIEFGEPEVVGYTYRIDVDLVVEEPSNYVKLLKTLTDKSFPLYIEYQNVLNYYKKLKARIEKKRNTESFFDD